MVSPLSDSQSNEASPPNKTRPSSLKMPIKWCLLIEKGIQKLKQYTTNQPSSRRYHFCHLDQDSRHFIGVALKKAWRLYNDKKLTKNVQRQRLIYKL